MTARRALRRIHLLSTIWFIACIGYLLVAVLRAQGFQWWVIFSLSGPSALLVFLLVSLYLFALYRGIGNAQQIEIEHPLTTTSHYMAFYVAAPLVGGLAGTVGMLGVTRGGTFLLGVALGTLGTTFAVWVVVDPMAGMIEMLLPASRRHRAQRLAEAEAQRRARQEKREHLLAEAFAREERSRRLWQQKLQGQAQRLAVLLLEIEGAAVGSAEREKAGNSAPRARVEQEAVELGAQAWRLGGLTCMKQLHQMTIQAVQEITRKTENGGRGAAASAVLDSTSSTVRPAAPDYLSYWWDGIGNWRKPSWS